MANNPHRFQLDLTREELDSIERLGNLAGLRTKREVVLNAVTLMKWAAKEILYGRTICSVDEKTQAMKQLEMPALTAIYESREQHPLLTAEQAQDRLREPSRPFSEFAPQQGVNNVASEMDSDRGGPVDGSMGTGAGQS